MLNSKNYSCITCNGLKKKYQTLTSMFQPFSKPQSWLKNEAHTSWCLESAWNISPSCLILIALNEEECILIVSFLPKSLSRVLWTSAVGIDRDAMRFQRLGANLDWQCGTYSLNLMCKCFLGRGELEFTRAVKLPLKVERSNALY